MVDNKKIDKEKIDSLLDEINQILKKQDNIRKQNGTNFNIFNIIGRSTDELVVCRVLHDLLSPNGSHAQGSEFLEIFVSDVLQMDDINHEELVNAKVYREFKTSENRRIDLLIETANYKIPIEVKIYAGEQFNQCEDYLSEAEDSKLVYLTRFGDEPSEFSIVKNRDQLQCISFAQDILNWLKKCIDKTDVKNIPPIREIISQFMQTIRMFTNQLEDPLNSEISEKIKTLENLQSAYAISNAFRVMQKNLLKDLFDRIDNKIKDKLDKEMLSGEFKIIEGDNHYRNNNYRNCCRFYDENKATYPAISYRYIKDLEPNVDIWVRIEVRYDNRMMLGYCCLKDGSGKSCRKIFLEEKKIEDKLKVEPKISGWWAYYEYIGDDNSNAIDPNFREHNEDYFSLFNEKNIDDYAELCATKFVDLLKKKIVLDNAET